MSETETEQRLRDVLSAVNSLPVDDGRAAVARARATAARRRAQQRNRLTIAAAAVAVFAVIVSGIWLAAGRRSPAVMSSPAVLGTTATSASSPLSGPGPTTVRNSTTGERAAGVVTVPNIVGMNSAQAAATVHDAGLGYREEHIYSDTPKGRVATQTPTPGASVGNGSTVVAQVSVGPEMAEVPKTGSVVGLTVEQATAALQAAGFRVHAQDTASALPKGQVLSMDLRPGSVVPARTVVTLTVSDNSLMVVPDIIHLTPEQAKAALKQAGWTADDTALVTTTIEDPERALWGRILKQQPTAGDVVAKISVVTVTVAAEPNIVMPDLTDKTVTQAYDLLHATGWHGRLTVVVHKELTPPAGKANLTFGQAPAPRSTITIATAITVDVYPSEAGG